MEVGFPTLPAVSSILGADGRVVWRTLQQQENEHRGASESESNGPLL